MTLVAGVDSSTQSCKVVVRDIASGEIVRSGSAAHPVGTEIDPAHWWTALLEAIEAAGGIDDVDAISIGGQQHGMVLLDASGRVIRPALLWNDTRSSNEASEIVAKFGATDIARRSGSLPVASFTSTKLRWVLNHEPENARRVAAVCLPHDWLSWRLAGFGPEGESERGADLSALATDRSDASGTGYFDSTTNEYLLDVVEFVLGHIPVLPRIVMPAETSYTTPGGMLIACGAGDNAAAAAGVGASTGDVVVSLGTSGTVFAVSDISTHDPSGTIAGFASASGSYLPLVCTLNAARVIDAMADTLELSQDALGELALEAPAGSGGVVMVPYFEGERTPNLPDATARIVGLTLSNTSRANLARASIEGMLCGLKAGLDALTGAGVSCERVFLVGGAARNPAVQRIAGEVFGVPIVVPQPGEYVALGATVQAVQAVTGTLPQWPRHDLATVDVPLQSVIASQYMAAVDDVLRLARQ